MYIIIYVFVFFVRVIWLFALSGRSRVSTASQRLRPSAARHFKDLPSLHHVRQEENSSQENLPRLAVWGKVIINQNPRTI